VPFAILNYVYRKLNVSREKAIPLIFEEIWMECGYRADLVVENKVIIEMKCVEILGDIHKAQTLTYLSSQVLSRDFL